MKKKILFIGLLILGTALVCAGFLLMGETANKTIPGVCIGVGAGLFGLSAANLITTRIKKKHPEIERRIEIDAKDERIVRINDMARARAFGVMEILYAILPVSLILLGVDMLPVFLVLGAYVIVWVTYFAYLAKYAKEM